VDTQVLRSSSYSHTTFMRILKRHRISAIARSVLFVLHILLIAWHKEGQKRDEFRINCYNKRQKATRIAKTSQFFLVIAEGSFQVSDIKASTNQYFPLLLIFYLGLFRKKKDFPQPLCEKTHLLNDELGINAQL
jgi:hypothetical protein